MISYYKRQEQISERQRAEMKANAGKPVKFDFRSAEQCRIDSAKEKKEIRITFHQRGHLLAKAKAEKKDKETHKKNLTFTA